MTPNQPGSAPVVTAPAVPPPPVEPDPLPTLHALNARTHKHVRRAQAVLGQQLDLDTLAGELHLLQSLFAEFMTLAYANHRYERILISDIEEDTDELAEEIAEVDAGEGGGIPAQLAARIAQLLGLLVKSINSSLPTASAEQQQQALLLVAECEAVVQELDEYVEEDDEEEDDAAASPEA